MKEEIRILTPNGILGYGIPEEDFWRGVERQPDAMIVDGGSTDPGPYLLGLPKTIVSRDAYLRDLTLMLNACATRKIPVYISSAGGAGIREQVDMMVELIEQIAKRDGYHFKIAKIYSDIDPELVRQGLAQGKIAPCGSAPALQEEDIDQSARIVAQIGAEPFIKVLREHPDVDIIVSGRAYDPAPFAALCAMHGIEPGIYWHMGKIVECGANCAEPKGKVILATVRRDSFDLEPMSLKERCTPASVAAHTLYEKARPDLLTGPGGTIDLREATYEPISDRAVRVSGSRFIEAPAYTVKLEGAGIVGMRTIFIGGIRDPILIGQIDDYLCRVKAEAFKTYPELRSGQAQLIFHVYGMNGVMGEFEPLADVVPHEIGLLGEVTAPTQELANTICNSVRIDVLHMPYEGQVATAGNFAIPLNPPENPIGPVCKFTVYHVMEIESADALFPFEIVEI
ncbi:acyclic terpene utilization AtuA family protein [Bordetella sp. 02P26C-1]|uniref:acyclic terpene utilization AtuA family protein n=1 Tax=Bordetella sp. 02P26C-1 TaxID=2683195 RepID=UPI0013532F7D|nr:acyclic terpene utilization AtuA family protein [Bordetella sp. 02P26C-1]MVW79472.1 acyclic terpene utilization AtuA family protein [Bordetella sp. 02P26C-1]